MSQIGAILKAAREKKGLTLEDLQAETKIQKRYLEHIEKGEFDMLPGSFYTRAFIRQFSDAVGVDTDELLSMFKDEIPVDAVDPSSSEMFTRVQKYNEREGFQNKFVEILPKIFLVCFIVIAIAIGYFFVVKYLNDSNGTETTEDSGEVIFYEPEKEETPTVDDSDDSNSDEDTDASDDENTDTSDDENNDTPEPVPTTQQELVPISAEGKTSVYELKNAPVGDIKLTLTATTDCWFGVEDQNGTSLFNGTVKPTVPQEVLIPSTTTEIYISIGNAPGGQVAVNGQSVAYQLPPNEVTTQTLVIKPVAQAPQ